MSQNSIFIKKYFGFFNECKKTIDISNLSDVKLAQQSLMNNNFF